MTNREKRTLSGPLLEVDIYPVWDDGRRVPSREPKTKETTAAQKEYNDKQAVKKIVRLVNANFDRSDYWMHPTYFPEAAPQDEKAARRDIVNYIRRVKSRREKEMQQKQTELSACREALAVLEQETTRPAFCYLREQIKDLKNSVKKLNEPLRYIYVIEKQTYKTGERAGRANWHFHIFISGGIDDKTMEQLWGNGIRVNCDNFQPDRFGPEAAGRYMSKDPQGARRWSCSKNLKKPKEKTRDGKYTRRQIEKIATTTNGAAEWWERKYPGYRFVRSHCRWNEYNANWYVTAVMYRTSGPPPAWLQEWGMTEGDDENDIQRAL